MKGFTPQASGSEVYISFPKPYGWDFTPQAIPIIYIQLQESTSRFPGFWREHGALSTTTKMLKNRVKSKVNQLHKPFLEWTETSQLKTFSSLIFFQSSDKIPTKNIS